MKKQTKAKNPSKLEKPVINPHPEPQKKVDTSQYRLITAICAIIGAAAQFTDTFIFAKDITIFSTALRLVAIFLVFMIFPFLVPEFIQKVKPKLLQKFINNFSINEKWGLKMVKVSSRSFLILLLLGLIIAIGFGAGSKAPLSLIHQIHWPFYRERKLSANGGLVETNIYPQYKGKSRVVKITFDTRNRDSYALWMVTFPDVSFIQKWTRQPYVSFQIRSESDDVSHVMFGIKDISGIEIKKELSHFIPDQQQITSSNWYSINIDLTRFSSEFNRPIAWQNLDNISFSLGHIDPDLTKDYVSFLVSDIVFWGNE